MKELSTNIKTAAFTGLILGLIFGTIDVIARIIDFSFEWFELYQTFLIDLVVLIIIFIILGILVKTIKKILRLNISRESIFNFYASTSIAVILLFYAEIIITKLIIYPDVPFDLLKTNRNFYVISLIIALTVGIIYIILLTKGMNTFKRIFLINKEKIKKLIKNYVFIVVIFIISSFVLDLYILNYTPKVTSNIDLEVYPNILVIVMDTVRADHLSVYNYTINTTPHLKKLSENSVVFENAISSSSWTLPSHSSMFTGRDPSKHNANKLNQLLSKKEATIAEILNKKGYNTAGFVGGLYIKSKYGFGQGFKTYDDRLDFSSYLHTFNKLSIRYVMSAVSLRFETFIFNRDDERTAEETNKRIFKWLDKNKERPFFMFINYFDAHHPYNRGQEFKENITKEAITHDIKNEEIIKYDTEIFYLDKQIGELMKKLEELGIKENTIIFITADHGEEFGEHGGVYHGRTLYEEVIHVPFIVYYPKEFNPRRVEKRIGTINIFPTILDILRIKIPEDIDSVSLLPLIKNEGEYNREYVFSELEVDRYESVHNVIINQKAVSYGNDWKLIEINPERGRYISGLFDLRSDPQEKENLYNSNPERRIFLQELIQTISKFFNSS